MKLLSVVIILCSFSSIAINAQQNGAPQPLPVPTPAGTPNTNTGLATKKESGNVNADLVSARAATKDHRYADAEALMSKDTQENPNLVLPWIELGLAQIGLKDYDKAENSFKIALGIDPGTQAKVHNDDFYQKADAPGVVAPGATRASRNTNAEGTVITGNQRTPDVLGTAYASLGEIYIHQKKIDEAKQSFDTAVKDNPTEAPLYRRNEMVFFFQAGNSDEQLKAAEQAIALDPGRAMLYYFKAQALVSQATIDSKTQKMVLPAGCADAYQKYLELEPNGPYSADARGVLAGAGVAVKTAKK